NIRCNVNPIQDIIISPLRNHIVIERNTFTEEPVKIVEHIKNLTVMETSTAQFTCELNKMNYNIEWFIGEVLIKDRPRFRMEHHEYSYTLYISDCKVEDGSEFTCVAGDVSSTATLTVQGT
ncbi:unnamed protein product, partial [Owenia fusiformis]